MATKDIQPTLATSLSDNGGEPVILRGQDLSIEEIVRVSRHGVKVQLTGDEEVLRRVEASCAYISKAVAERKPIYGVTTGFGGMAHVVIPPEEMTDLQNNVGMWFMKCGAGKRLPNADVRAAMLLRANSHLHGASGIRLEIIQRIIIFLNNNVTPHVREFGSIGASGDLVPLTQITGALLGGNESFMVDFDGQELDALTALKRLGLERMRLRPKEGLAMVNGTSVMAGIAANCVYDAYVLLALAMGVHALAIQALAGTNQSFHPFIHAVKPHPGQIWAAEKMLGLLAGSGLIRDELNGRREHHEGELIQDRYSLRCLPQYTGPIVDGLRQISRQITIEANSATDNPLIDVDNDTDYHGGNFLGQYVGVAMDQLRYYLGLLAKHLDVQLAVLVAPEFNNGLPPSLIGNRDRKSNMGFKGLQLAGNSIMPLLTFLGNSLVDRYPTHAEQFNQNINSQGFGSANLARQSIETFQQYMAIALLFGVQAVDLRTYNVAGHYDARETLSPATRPFYEAVREVVGRPPAAERPFIRNDDEQILEQYIIAIVDDIIANGRIPQAVAHLMI